MYYKTKVKYWILLGLIDMVGNLLFFWKKLKKFPKNPKKILIIRLDHIGDMIMTTPFISNLKLNFPNSKLDILCRSISKQVIEDNKDIANIIEFNPSWFSRVKDDEKLSNLKDIKKIKQENYDLVFELHTDPRNIMLGSVIGKYLVGYGNRGMGFLLNKRIKWKNDTVHIVDRNLDILKSLKLKVLYKNPKLIVNKKEQNKIKKKLKEKNITNFYILHPFSGIKDNELSINESINLCNRLKNKTIVLTGTKKEAKRLEEISKKVKGNNIYNFGGKTNIKELIAIINLSDKIISVDTAVAHIASSLNKDQLVICKTANAKEWGPYRKTKMTKVIDLSGKGV